MVEVEISKQDVLPWEAQLLLGFSGKGLLGLGLGSVYAVDAHRVEVLIIEVRPDGLGV